jgi:hypothetical protein
MFSEWRLNPPPDRDGEVPGSTSQAMNRSRLFRASLQYLLLRSVTFAAGHRLRGVGHRAHDASTVILSGRSGDQQQHKDYRP